MWTPRFHHQSDLTGFQTFERLMSRSVTEDGPLHSANPALSSISVLTFEEYKSKSAQEVQFILRDKHIAITGMPQDGKNLVDFDAPGLRHLVHLDAKIHMQGLSSQFSAHCTQLADPFHRPVDPG
jgi:hypothetical protein